MPGRPFFLVSTTPAAANIRDGLGTPAYSYYFAVEALAPILERFGGWRLVDRPESRLPFLAALARHEGFRPIHLIVNPVQDAYFSPSLPNVLLPFWEFPDLPDRDLGDDPRQDWTRGVRGADLVIAECRYTAEAFRRANVACPVAVVPVPVASNAFDLPAWNRDHSWSICCRHEVLGLPSEVVSLEISNPTPGRQGLARSAFQRVAPWLGPDAVDRIAAARRGVKRILQARPNARSLRLAYRQHVRPWLSDRAVERVTKLKEGVFRLAGRVPTEPVDPPLPSRILTLGPGLVYTSIFNVGDPRKNWKDLLSAFLLAFHDRADVTLAIKLVTSRRCEHHEAGFFRSYYESLGISHKCRIVVIVEYLNDAAMDELFRATTFYVNTSHAEGACLPLMRSLAGGRPAIAPDHSALGDFMNSQVGFVPRSHPEPTCFPHDPEKRLATWRHRLVWSDLRDAFLESARVADHDPERYAAMASAAQARMARHAGHDVAERALQAALEKIDLSESSSAA